MSAGYAEARGQIGDTIRANGKTASCIRTPFEEEIEFEINGKRMIYDSVVDIEATEATRLGIADRIEATIGGKSLRVISIGTDAQDPCWKVTLAASL